MQFFFFVFLKINWNDQLFHCVDHSSQGFCLCSEFTYGGFVFVFNVVLGYSSIAKVYCWYSDVAGPFS